MYMTMASFQKVGATLRNLLKKFVEKFEKDVEKCEMFIVHDAIDKH